ncbi:hypothetical protein MCP1_250015 [Candidatus Terasakiella magnetica]|nr:hypothetical protein MCP1_250015 [Candidatus Terasakiella magnetica]
MKNSSSGEPGGNWGISGPLWLLLTVCVVEILTTAGNRRSTRSAKLPMATSRGAAWAWAPTGWNRTATRAIPATSRPSGLLPGAFVMASRVARWRCLEINTGRNLLLDNQSRSQRGGRGDSIALNYGVIMAERTSQTAKTPSAAHMMPTARSREGGVSSTWAIRRRMTSGNKAQATPSITNTRPRAVRKSAT